MRLSYLSHVAAALLLLLFASACQAIRPLNAIRSAFDRNPSAAEVPNSIDYSNIPQNRTRDGGFILGRRSAPITMIVFQDYLCSHCQAYQTTVRQFIEEQVVTGQARFEYRFFPVIDATYSAFTADLTECAEVLRPGSFWMAHDLMFVLASENRPRDILDIFADEMQFDADELIDCSQQEADQVETDSQYGLDLGVSGTPAVFLRFGNDAPEWISPTPNYDELEALIDAWYSSRKNT